MNVLQQIIGAMTKEEQRNYKLFINRTEKKGDRKDELLFDFIRKNYPLYEEDLIQKELYGKAGKNALYRLKNRVLEDISKSIMVLHYDETEYNSTLNNLVLSYVFSRKSLWDVAFFYLEKAERTAAKNEFFEILDLIYTELIRLSHETLEIDPEVYIKKKKSNREKINKIQQIDDILAVLIFRIKTTQMVSVNKDLKVLDILQKTVNEFSRDKGLKKSPSLRFRIYHALSRILLQRDDFISLEAYLVKTYNEFSNENLFNKNNHDTKLQMLTYIVNSLYKNDKIQQSLAYAEKLNDAMKQYNGLLYDNYLFFYYNSLVFNNAAVDLDKTIAVLNEAIENPIIKKVPMQVAFVYINFSLIYFHKNEFKIALKNLLRSMMEESYKKLDDVFKLKINILELIFRYEVGDYEYLEHRAKQIVKEYGILLKSKANKRDLEMINMLDNMVKTGKRIRKKINIKQQILDFVSTYKGQQNNDLVNYDTWLLSKVKSLH